MHACTHTQSTYVHVHICTQTFTHNVYCKWRKIHNGTCSFVTLYHTMYCAIIWSHACQLQRNLTGCFFGAAKKSSEPPLSPKRPLDPKRKRTKILHFEGGQHTDFRLVYQARPFSPDDPYLLPTCKGYQAKKGLHVHVA